MSIVLLVTFYAVKKALNLIRFHCSSNQQSDFPVLDQAWGVHYVAVIAHYPEYSPPISSLFSYELFSGGTGPKLTVSLSFLPGSMWSFLTALVVQESFSQFPISV